MLQFFQSLFASNFMPHGHCYQWLPEIVWLHAVSDAIIGVSYYSIPILLGYFAHKRRDLEFKWMFVLFGAFIMACGTTHLLEVWTIWNGTYRLTGVVKLATGFISAATAVLLMPLVPKALALPSPSMLREVNRSLEEQISERKETEEALARRARELNVANQRLVEAERSKNEFFANISHEIRTPLTLILAPVESLLADASSSLTPEQERTLQTVHNNAVRLLQMITGILDFSRLEAGKMEVEREKVDLVALAQSALADFSPLLEHKGLETVFASEPERMSVETDRYLVERMLFNLLSNAVKFTPEGGKVTVLLKYEEGQVRMSVMDTGIGIAEEDLQDLFRKFRQINGDATRRFEGSGIGLALVREFAALLGGTVSVQSKPGEGSTFTVTLPAGLQEPNPSDSAVHSSKTDTEAGSRAAAPMAQRYRSAETGETAFSGEAPVSDTSRILVAEDNPEMGEYLASLLEHWSVVRQVRTGQAAIEATREWRPDLVIADVMMPEMDGYDLCRAIKQDDLLSDIPVILLTALTNREALLKGWNAGADEYLYKPFHPRELATRVRNILQAQAQRRRTISALKESEQRFRSVFDNAAIGIATADVKGHFMEANGAFQQMLGYSLAELQERTFEDVTHPEDRARDQMLFNELLTGKRTSYQLEKRYIHRGGHRVWINLSVGLVRDQEDEPMYAVATVQNIDDLKTAEQQLLQAYEREAEQTRFLDSILSSTSDHVYLFDAKKKYRYASKSGLEALGVSLDEIVDRSWQEIAMPEDVMVPFERRLDEVLARAEPRRGETVYPTADGLRTYSYVVNPVMGEEGAPTGAVVSARDITERVEAEKRLSRTNDMLEQRNRELQDFAYVASHDLQEPLRKIRSFGAMLADEHQSSLDETAQDYLSRMQNAAERMSALITDLLAFSRVSTQGRQFRPTDLNEVVQGVLQDLEIAIEESNAQVTVASLPEIDADPVQMRQLFQNLIGNGLKFSREGEAPRVNVNAEIEESDDPQSMSTEICRIEIRDEGIGFDERYLERIFAPFKRLHGRQSYSGTGMGLAIVRRIVERHSGSITARSKPDEGATFIVRLPAKQDNGADGASA